MNSLPLAPMIDHPRETVARAQQAPLLLEENGAPVAVVLSVEEYETILEDRRRALDRYVAAFDAEIEKGFAGPFEELTPAVWDEIRRGDGADLEGDSLALPPG